MAGLLDFLQSASNSVAGNVTGPVDGIAWLLRKAGIDVGEPVGGSDWAKRKGLMRDVQQSAASLAGETAGLLGPIAVAAKAPQIARGLLQAGENLAAPRTLHAQRGAFLFPRDKAMETAQKNATEMLGLQPNNTAADRARALGFETAPSKTTYHGSREPISGPVDPARSDFGFHTGTIDQADARLRAFALSDEMYPSGANIVPIIKSRYANLLKVADEGSFHADALAPQLAKKGLVDKAWAKRVEKEIGGDWKKAAEYDAILRRVMSDNGLDGIKYSNAQEGAGLSYAFSNPSVIRSRFAAFDPARVNEPDLLATLAAMGIGLPALAGLLNSEAQ